MKIYDSMLDVSSVATGYQYWRRVLVEKIIRLFEYEGLPPTIPGTELEKIVLLTGKAGIINTDKYGYVAVPCAPYGVGLYPSYYPLAIWSTPLLRGDGVVNRDIVIIRNNAFMTGISETVDRYARMLADVESTLALSLINVRQPAMAAAPDEQTAYSYQAARLAMALGDTEAILNRSVLDDIKTIDAIHTIPATLLTDIVSVRDELLSQFFAEFGVASRQSKRAPMTETEVESDVQVMTVNVTDMLKSREESLDAVKAVYKLDIKVKISDAYKPISGSKPKTFNQTGDPLTGKSITGGGDNDTI
ncbi:MAG: hypothetical protein IIZ78_00445 [Clostridiales bacterium]|nr:hypothetical protein [Clostridiales bacterium]